MTTAAPSTSASGTASIDETARREFESAWRLGRPEPIERYLPPPDHPSFLPTLEELVHIDLEFAWKSGGRPSSEATVTHHERPVVESYLARFPQLMQPEI